LLGNGKKIAKFLMRTFTYRSTFLYGSIPTSNETAESEGRQMQRGIKKRPDTELQNLTGALDCPGESTQLN
jgi:hypothetical protein